MSIASRLKIESRGMFATFIFYAIVGVIFLVLLPLSGFPPHIGIMGIFSLVAAYGIFQKRKWAIWLVVILFFVATTFSLYMIYYYLAKDYTVGLSTIAYLILTWIFTIYAASKRGTLET
jgi:hypothetical protein